MAFHRDGSSDRTLSDSRGADPSDSMGPDMETSWWPRSLSLPKKGLETIRQKLGLVVLGFEDPQIEALARDSPTLGRESRMLLLQFAAAAKWQISTFDIQTAFLRGSRTDGRILGVEPPQEMRVMMNLKPWECCELRKSAYGLVNAPLLWYEELQNSPHCTWFHQITFGSLSFRTSQRESKHAWQSTKDSWCFRHPLLMME